MINYQIDWLARKTKTNYEIDWLVQKTKTNLRKWTNDLKNYDYIQCGLDGSKN